MADVAFPSAEAPKLAELALTARVRLSRRLTRFLIRHSFKGAARLRRYLARMLIPTPSGPVVVPTTMGLRLCVDPSHDRAIERAIYYEGVYEAGTLHVVRGILRPGDAFVDVGANIGLISLVGAVAVGAAGHVHAFEPLPSTFAILQRNIALNAARNVHAYPLALGSSDERRPMYQSEPWNRGAASLVVPNSATPAAMVRVATLDGFLAEKGIRNVRALKVDVEGWEAEVLIGAKRLLGSREPPILVVEYIASVEPSGGSARRVYEMLSSLSEYRVYKLRRGKDSVSKLRPIRDAGDLPAHDNLFCFPLREVSGMASELFEGED
jgi:FkbM family methyltransferase